VSSRNRVPSASELVEELLTLTQAIRRRHNAGLADYDSSVPRAQLLRAMLALGTPRMSDLAVQLGLTARTTLIELTPAGRAHIREWQAFQRQLSEEVLAPLNAVERRQLMRLLQRIRTEGLSEAI
jgi:hypothetical protein